MPQHTVLWSCVGGIVRFNTNNRSKHDDFTMRCAEGEEKRRVIRHLDTLPEPHNASIRKSKACFVL